MVIEYGILLINIVSVLLDNIGMEEIVLFNLNVQEIEFGILLHLNANVQEILNGIQKCVKLVKMDKYGIKLQEVVSVQEVQYGMIIFVELLNNVMEERCGSSKIGLVSVLLLQFGMETFVYQIHV